MGRVSATIRNGALGLLAGLVGSLCCFGPSAAILLGLGSSSALAGFAFDRGATLAGGCALVVGGLLLARRNRHLCVVPGRSRWRQPALIVISFALAYGLLATMLPAMAERQADAADALIPSASAQPGPDSLRRVTLLVEKMYCRPCAAHLRGLLRRKPYVRRFTAETNQQQVIVDYDSQQISTRAVIALFPQSYGVELVSDQALP